jgi:uncharacterized protein YoxC
MKLSRLVEYRNYIADLDTKKIKTLGSRPTDEILDKIKEHHSDLDIKVENLDQIQKSISTEIDKFNQTLTDIKQSLDKQILSLADSYDQRSRELFEEMRNDSTEWVLRRRNKFNEEATEFFSHRSKLYSKWTHPTLVIRPAHNPFLKDLVDGFPLYYIDQNLELINEAFTEFPPEFVNRIRPYVVDEYDPPHNLLDALPKNQFGLAIAFYYFNFKPEYIIKKYLEDVYQLLKPGGAFLLTINDCDYPGAAILAENSYCCYISGLRFKAVATGIGYNVSYEQHLSNGIHWYELSKPGKLTSIKGGQTLAKIVAKDHTDPEKRINEANAKILLEDLVNVLERQNIKYQYIDSGNNIIYNNQKPLVEIATLLNVDLNKSLDKNKVSVKLLIKLIRNVIIYSDKLPTKEIVKFLKQRNKK